MGGEGITITLSRGGGLYSPPQLSVKISLHFRACATIALLNTDTKTLATYQLEYYCKI